MSQTKQHQCCATVMSLAARKAMQKELGYTGVSCRQDYFQCPNKAKVCRDGKYYCGVHDPVAVAARHKKQDEAKRTRQRMHITPRDTAESAKDMAEFYRKEIDLQQRMVQALAKKVAQLTRGWNKALDSDFCVEYWLAWAKHDAESAVAAGEGE